MAAGTPDFSELLKDAFRDVLKGLYIILPGRVDSYDSSTGKATITPAYGRYLEPTPENPSPGSQAIPQISEIPVAQWTMGGWSQVSSPEAGDLVILLVSQRSLDEWLDAGGDQVAPPRGRMFNINDAVALPVVFGTSSTANLVFEGHGAKVELKTNGDVILNDGTLGAARDTDATVIDNVSDSAFITLIQAAASLLGLPTPTSITGRISGGSSSVKVGG